MLSQDKYIVFQILSHKKSKTQLSLIWILDKITGYNDKRLKQVGQKGMNKEEKQSSQNIPLFFRKATKIMFFPKDFSKPFQKNSGYYIISGLQNLSVI